MSQATQVRVPGFPFGRGRQLRPPRWVFHGVLAGIAVVVLVAFSYPGLDVLSLLWAVPALLAGAALWFAWLVVFVTVRVRARRRPWSWWFLPAPAGLVLIVALIAAGVPLQLRWALSRPAFDAVLAGLPAPPPKTSPAEEPDQEEAPEQELPAALRNLPLGFYVSPEESPEESEDESDWIPAYVPGRVGLYLLRGADLVPGGVIFTEVTGNLGDDAGFAYLPAGPDPDLENGSFERPQFQPLGGPWYAWTASW